jgi:hypothetical protein
MRTAFCRLAIAMRDFFNPIAAGVLCRRSRAALKKLMLENARSHYREQPIDFSCAGTPEEFRKLCAESHVEIELEFPIIKIAGYPLSSGKQ